VAETGGKSKLALKAAVVSLIATLLVVAVKLVAAALSGSVSVLAEGLQSLLDVFMSILSVWAIRIAAAPPDEDHPYGHGKAEYLSSAFQMLIVLAASALIIFMAVQRLANPREIEVGWGIYAMGFAAVVNIAVITYLRRVNRTAKSAALEGETEHLRGDTLASGGILVGLIAYSLIGWQPLDPIIAIIFTGFSGYYAVRQLRKVIHPLMDGALPASQMEALNKELDSHPEVRGHHRLRTRFTGNHLFVSLHVLLDDDLSFVKAHDIAEEIEAALGASLGGAQVTVHYEPYEAEMVHQAAEHHDS
jgi:cation diffusion facilitator family transporter